MVWKNKHPEPGPREWYEDPSLGPETRSSSRFHRLLAAAVIAQAIVETTERRDRQRVEIAKRGRGKETWQKLESWRWLMGETDGRGIFSFAYLCDQLGWNRRALSGRLRQPDRIPGSWSLPREAIIELNAHHAVFSELESEEADILHGRAGYGTVWAPDPVLLLQHALREMVQARQQTGRVRELAQFSPEEQERSAARILSHGIWNGKARRRRWTWNWHKEDEGMEDQKPQRASEAAAELLDESDEGLLRRFTGASAEEVEALRVATAPSEWAEFVRAAKAALLSESGRARPDLLQAVWIGMGLGFFFAWLFVAWESGRLL